MSSTPYTGAGPLRQVIPFPLRAEARTGAWFDDLRRFDLVVGVFERAMDLVAALAALETAYWICAAWRSNQAAPYARNTILTSAVGFSLLIVLLLEKHGDYQPWLSLLAVRETERLLRVTISGVLLAAPILVVVARALPVAVIALSMVMLPLFLALEKIHTQSAVRLLRRRLGATRTAVILGTGILGRKVFSTLVRSPKLGIDTVVFVAEDSTVEEMVVYESAYQRKQQAKVLPGPATPRLLRKLGASVLIFADPEMPADEAATLRNAAEAAGMTTCVVPEPFLDEDATTEYLEMDGVLLAYNARRGERRLYRVAKRALDVGLSALLLVLCVPVLGAAAVAVRLGSAGPVIFRQQRVGRNGRHFAIYKFRTMHSDCARYATSPISGRDPRITRVGRFLRHTCIDELPQLVNVLRGEMSLVGPRPEMPFVVEQYEPIHLKRLSVLPGLTGLWQLSADRQAPIHENISYDLYYVRHRSVLMDMAILLHTLVFAFRGV
ncbi:MAG: exopolysaccharide biosynthesis polyprenyl glycosylphosphotransferase [Candidatus Korobacteraceae bacterium]